MQTHSLEEKFKKYIYIKHTNPKSLQSFFILEKNKKQKTETLHQLKAKYSRFHSYHHSSAYILPLCCLKKRKGFTLKLCTRFAMSDKHTGIVFKLLYVLVSVWGWGEGQDQCCFMSTETIRTIRDVEPRTIFTPLLGS